MSSNSFVRDIGNVGAPNEDGSVYNSLFKQYERVVIESLITSFGLDLLIKDQHGGDVDTVNNVRKIGSDQQMTYKSDSNQDAYKNRTKYRSTPPKEGREEGYMYHYDFTSSKDSNFRKVYSEGRKQFQSTGKLKDEYTGGDLLMGKAKNIDKDKRANLDHIIPIKEIMDDRGKVLSGVDANELVDDRSNLAWTNESLNHSKGARSNPVYVNEGNGKSLDDETKKRMLDKDKQAREVYNAKINRTYYTSKRFFTDTAKASLNLGAKMGLRQALGFVFSEIWFSVKEEIDKGAESGEKLFQKIGNGINNGLSRAKENYAVMWNKFIEGSVAGVLSSLTTTLCNIFFTTAKNVVRIIRQSWASFTEAIKILLFNPDDLLFGERIRAAAKILATGASVVAGAIISQLIEGTPFGQIPVIGDIVQIFCGTLVTGILSCTFLYLLDNNNLINQVVNALNKIPCVEKTLEYYREQGRKLDEYFATLLNLDIESYEAEVQNFCYAASLLEDCKTEKELNVALKSVYKLLDLPLPWGNGSFDDFMNDPHTKLSFC